MTPAAATTSPAVDAETKDTPRYPRIVVGVLLGILSGGVALGVAELMAGVIGGAASPILAVGSSFIDATPEWLKSYAIRTFGSNDKTALLAGIGAVLLIAAVALGIASVRRFWLGIAGLVGLGVIGAMAAATRPANGPVDAIPSLVGAAAGVGAYLILRRAAGLPARHRRDEVDEPETAAPPVFDRRRFLWTGIAAGGVALTAGKAGRWLVRRADASASRDAVGVPTSVNPAAPIPDGAQLDVPGISPFVTPNDRFYRVDTALFVPSVAADAWTLRVHGMVDREISLTYDQLVARPLIERDITLTCVSNEVGGRYLGTARWIGTPLKDLLEEAGVQAAATQLVATSTDGFTAGTPVAIAMDGRDAMLAVSMNGEPLPIEHGFPVRMIVPGLYGYVSATKWIADLELTTFEAFDPYWAKRGWAKQAPIKTESRIDTPRARANIPAGEVAVAGVAWAQHRGIEAVEVQVDGGPWAPAELGVEATVDTWRQWVYRWNATPGAHTLAVRATDGTGATQTPEHADPFPNGATGDHTIEVNVT